MTDYTSRQNLGALADAKDFFDSYNASNVDFEIIRNKGLVSISWLPKDERLFCADSPIENKMFALDHAGRYWLCEMPGSVKVRNQDIAGKKAELMYLVGKELGLGVAETRVATVDAWKGEKEGVIYRDAKIIASRFLTNAIESGFIRKVPQELQEKVESKLDAFWPFNFLTGFCGDTQYVFTPKGHVMMVDYFAGTLFNPDLIRLGENRFWNPDTQWDIGIQKKELQFYRLPYVKEVNRAGIDKTIDAIEGLSDEFLEQVVQILPETYEREGQTIAYPEEIIKGLQWRRNNVREVFSDVV